MKRRLTILGEGSSAERLARALAGISGVDEIRILPPPIKAGLLLAQLSWSDLLVLSPDPQRLRDLSLAGLREAEDKSLLAAVAQVGGDWRVYARPIPQPLQPLPPEEGEDCQDCGACCFVTGRQYCRLRPGDAERLGENAQELTTQIGGRTYMRIEDGRCVALQLEGGRWGCSIYVRRPEICREVQPGSPTCCEGRARNLTQVRRLALASTNRRPGAGIESPIDER